MDKRYGGDTNEAVRNKSDFNLPVKKTRNGDYKLPDWCFVRVCMASDFFIEEADGWRIEAWDFIRRRPWGDGWDNVSFSVSCENQKRLEERIPYLLDLPAKHRRVSLKPFIGGVDIAPYLKTGKIETVLTGGENYLGFRPLHYEWVKKLYDACAENNVQLIFGQTGNIFIKDGKEYKVRNRTEQMVQALKSGLHYPPVDREKEVETIYARKTAMKAAFEAKRKPKEEDKFHC